MRTCPLPFCLLCPFRDLVADLPPLQSLLDSITSGRPTIGELPHSWTEGRLSGAIRRCSRRLFHFGDLGVIRPEHHLRPKPIFCLSAQPAKKPGGESTCAIQLNAPTASRLVAVSMIVSSMGRNDDPSSFSAFALDSRRTLPSSNNWPRTSPSKRPTIRTSQSGSLRVGTFFAYAGAVRLFCSGNKSETSLRMRE